MVSEGLTRAMICDILSATLKALLNCLLQRKITRYGDYINCPHANAYLDAWPLTNKAAIKPYKNGKSCEAQYIYAFLDISLGPHIPEKS